MKVSPGAEGTPVNVNWVTDDTVIVYSYSKDTVPPPAGIVSWIGFTVPTCDTPVAGEAVRLAGGVTVRSAPLPVTVTSMVTNTVSPLVVTRAPAATAVVVLPSTPEIAVLLVPSSHCTVPALPTNGSLVAAGLALLL